MMIVQDWDDYSPYFHREEFVCPCGCDQANMRINHMNKLLDARKIANVPFIILSGFRCRSYNHTIGGRAASDHVTGHGSDIRALDSSTYFEILSAAILAGFLRIGPNRGAIHLGNNPTNPQRVCWTYY